MKIGVFGAGAVGCAVSSMMYNKYKDNLYFLCDETRAVKIKKGLSINNEIYKFNVMTQGSVDVLFVCVKNFSLVSSLSEIERFVSDNTIIIPLLNGIDAKSTLQEKFPNNNVFYSIIRVEATRDASSNVNFKEIYTINFGEEDNTVLSSDVLLVKEILDNSNIVNEVCEDMPRAVWLKWMLNMGINQVSALTSSTYKQMGHPKLQELLFKCFMEVVMIAKYEGVNIFESDALALINNKKTWSSDKYTSTAQDFMYKRENEIEFFSHTLIKLAKKHNVEVPVNEVLYCCLKAMSDFYL